jgi:membrane-bound ClpP family serine protease
MSNNQKKDEKIEHFDPKDHDFLKWLSPVLVLIGIILFVIGIKLSVILGIIGLLLIVIGVVLTVLYYKKERPDYSKKDK